MWQTNLPSVRVTILVMPPRILPRRPVRVFLAEHREAHVPKMTQEDLGARIRPPVDKGTVSRWESAPPGRLSTGVIAAYAEALGKTAPEMYFPPNRGPSLDIMAAGLDDDLRGRAVAILEALRGRKAS